MTFFTRRAAPVSSLWKARAFPALSALTVAAMALLATLSPGEAAFRQPPGGRIAVDIGAGFKPSDKFSGFVDASTGALMAVIDLPAEAYDRLKTIPDSEEGLANEGFSGTAKAELKGRQGAYVYLVGKQAKPDGDITKFVLIFKDGDVTGLIVANVPQKALDAGAYTREGIETILATAAVRSTPRDPNALFDFGYLGPFKQALDDGGMTKAYNISGARPQPGENQLVKEAMLMVSSTIHGDSIDVKAQADNAFMQLGGVKERRIDDKRDITIGNLRGYQIAGEVIDDTTANPIAIRLVVLSGEPYGYFVFLGSAPAAEKEKMMPEIEKVIASFELAK